MHRQARPEVRGASVAGTRGPSGAAAVAVAAHVTVLVGVTTGATQGLDQRAVDWLRPGDEWGTAQVRLEPFIDGLEPVRAYAFLALVTLVVCLRRRTWAPARFAGLLAGTGAGLTWALKVATHRLDPHGDLASTGGSFPSGHVVALVTCLGCCALLCWRRTRWWQWCLVAAPPLVLAAAMLVTAAHWATDVVGGALLAVATLCWAASLPLRASAYPSWGS